MTFSNALEIVKAGNKIQRRGWNGKGMFVYYVPPGKYSRCTDVAKCIADENDKITYGAYLALKTATGEVVPWTISQTDALAEDWEVCE